MPGIDQTMTTSDGVRLVYDDEGDVEGMAWFAGQVPSGMLTVFDRGGHSPHVSEAEVFNRQLLEFAGLSASREDS